MSDFPIHSLETAPEKARARLVSAETRFGFLPNLLAGLAEAPAVLDGYLTLADILDTASLSEAEKQVVLIAGSVVNNCDYCVAAHSTAAAELALPAGTVAALRTGRPIDDAKLQALRRFTEALIVKQGWVEADEVDDFLAVGFSRQQALEVVLAIALKTISNYANRLLETPLDEAFAAQAWAPGEGALKRIA